MNTLWSQSVDDLLSAISSSSPVPGGGSASAISGLIGIALVQMAINVSKESDQGEHNGNLNSAYLALESVSKDLRSATLSDITSFEAYMAALKLPRGEPHLDEARNRALDTTCHDLLLPSFAIAESLSRSISIAKDAIQWVKPNIVSDLFAGVELMQSAALATLLNVDVNLMSKRLVNVKNEFTARRASLVTKLEAVVRHIRHEASGRGFRVNV